MFQDVLPSDHEATVPVHVLTELPRASDIEHSNGHVGFGQSQGGIGPNRLADEGSGEGYDRKFVGSSS
eukprot:2284893-Amphidinium_carterae.1